MYALYLMPQNDNVNANQWMRHEQTQVYGKEERTTPKLKKPAWNSMQKKTDVG